MREVDVLIPANAPLDYAETIIEGACTEEGLILMLKDTLKHYPGCIHWHYQREGVSGTLEITLWVAKRRIWFKVSARREGAWIDAVIESLQQTIGDELAH